MGFNKQDRDIVEDTKKDLKDVNKDLKEVRKHLKTDIVLMAAISVGVGMSINYSSGWLNILGSIAFCFSSMFLMDRIMAPGFYKLFNKKKK